MRFVIRANGSAEIGVGHVMRSCAIAEELIDGGQEVVFVGEIWSIPWVQARVSELGFSNIYEHLNEFQPNPKTDMLILDSYEIDPLDLFLRQELWRGIVAIVDGATPQVFADLYIHPGTDTSWNPPSLARHIKFLSGINYIPIRRAIQTFKLELEPSSKAELKILVIGGGSDFLDFCGAIGNKLHKLPEQFSATFFAGPKTSLPPDVRFTIVTIGAKIENFLNDVDLIFTTAGTSSWEFLSCGFPIGLACAVDNQVANYQYQTKEHLAIGIGKTNNDGNWDLDINAIQKLVENSEFRSELSARATQIIDGKGSARIADAIMLLAANLN